MASSMMSRRALVIGGTATVAILLEGQMSKATTPEPDHDLKTYDVSSNGITLHVTEMGNGPAVLFAHGFPDTRLYLAQADGSAGVRRLPRDRA